MVTGTPPGVPGKRGEVPGERDNSAGEGEEEEGDDSGGGGGGGGLSFENRFWAADAAEPRAD